VTDTLTKRPSIDDFLCQFCRDQIRAAAIRSHRVIARSEPQRILQIDRVVENRPKARPAAIVPFKARDSVSKRKFQRIPVADQACIRRGDVRQLGKLKLSTLHQS
jgi:hypothetical protein